MVEGLDSVNRIRSCDLEDKGAFWMKHLKYYKNKPICLDETLSHVKGTLVRVWTHSRGGSGQIAF